MNYKKYLMIAAIILMFIFPEYIFTGLGVILLVIVIVFFVVDIAFDIYIFVVFLIRWLKER
ncbi:MAG: hypothetical protein U9R26_06385, partial [Campylobacterota bacterium]|nr:hypothetical protein [Campylobacterota bacterium]